MRPLVVLAVLLAGCGDNLIITPRYWSCDTSSTCAGDSTCQEAGGWDYCTTACQAQADCDQYGWPAVCTRGFCFGECWPRDTGTEDLAFCREYGFLCPSDCAAQGLVCDAVTGALYPRYGCVKE